MSQTLLSPITLTKPVTSRFVSALKCETCGQTGSALGELRTSENDDAVARVATIISAGFFREGRNDDAATLIVCDICETHVGNPPVVRLPTSDPALRQQSLNPDASMRGVSSATFELLGSIDVTTAARPTPNNDEY